jgi:CO/xanthine dehydrogenase FAD-binding subunit
VKISLPITEVNYGFYEVTRRHGDYASAGAIITLHKQNNFNTQNSRVVLFASTNKPERIIGLEDILNRIEPGTTPIVNKETITDALMNTKLEKDLHNSERTKFIHSVTALKRALEMIK